MPHNVLQNYALIFCFLLCSGRAWSVVVVISDTVYTNNDINSNHYLYYDKAEELESKDYKKLSDDSIGDDKIVPCNNKDDCIKNYTVDIEYALSLNSSLVHEPYCDNDMECTCGTYCLSQSRRKDNGEFFYYCGPCGRIGSYCGKNRTICRPNSVTTCNDDYCDCTDNGDFYDIYFCYISYYGYEIALQLAISTCIAIALCLLVASIYNAIGFRRIRRMQDLRQMLRSETGGVRESPPDDIPPKYDDVMDDLPSYQDALKMYQNSSKHQRNGVINEAFEDDSSGSHEEGWEERSQTHLNIAPTINRKKSNKSDSKTNVNDNRRIQSNNIEEDNLVGSLEEGTIRVPKYVRKKTSRNSVSGKSSLNDYNGRENEQEPLTLNEDGHAPILHTATTSQDSNDNAVAKINEDNDRKENITTISEISIDVTTENDITMDNPPIQNT